MKFKNWKEVLICTLLIVITFLGTRLWRDEQILNMQDKIAKQANGIARSQQIIQAGINNGGKIDVQALKRLGWNLNIPVDNELPSNLPDSTKAEDSSNL